MTSHLLAQKVVRKGDSPKSIYPKKKSNGAFSPIIEKTIRRLNELAGTSFLPTTRATRSHITDRILEGFTEGNLIAVVEDRCARWLQDPKMRQYLRPATLFNSEKFESYLQVSNGNGHAKPVEVKDLGDGFVEVDGRPMDKRLYERRFANGN